ncbi:unnamed protein product [Closterium sp. NIES-53]
MVPQSGTLLLVINTAAAAGAAGRADDDAVGGAAGRTADTVGTVAVAAGTGKAAAGDAVAAAPADEGACMPDAECCDPDAAAAPAGAAGAAGAAAAAAASSAAAAGRQVISGYAAAPSPLYPTGLDLDRTAHGSLSPGIFLHPTCPDLDNTWILKPWNLGRSMQTPSPHPLSPACLSPLSLPSRPRSGQHVDHEAVESRAQHGCNGVAPPGADRTAGRDRPQGGPEVHISRPVLFHGRKFDMRLLLLLKKLKPLEAYISDVFWVSGSECPGFRLGTETGLKVAQKYISRPALFHVRKFDLRLLLLLKRLKPLEAYLSDVFWVSESGSMLLACSLLLGWLRRSSTGGSSTCASCCCSRG